MANYRAQNERRNSNENGLEIKAEMCEKFTNENGTQTHSQSKYEIQKLLFAENKGLTGKKVLKWIENFRINNIGRRWKRGGERVRVAV